jgi:hypothetical protein
VTVSLDQLRRCHVAVDLGAARTRVFVKGAGLVVDEPSVAAVNTRTGALIAVGALAEKMTGRTPDYIRVVRPVPGCAPPPAPRTTAIRWRSAPPSRPSSVSGRAGSSWSTP